MQISDEGKQRGNNDAEQCMHSSMHTKLLITSEHYKINRVCACRLSFTLHSFEETGLNSAKV